MKQYLPFNYVPLLLGISLFIFNYEFFFINAEGIYIISFLLFYTRVLLLCW